MITASICLGFITCQALLKVLYVYYVILITAILSPTLEMRKLRHRVTFPEVTQLSIVSQNVLAGLSALNVH